MATLAVVLVATVAIDPSGGASLRRTAGTKSDVPRVLAVHPAVVHGRGGAHILVMGRHFTPSTTLTVGGRRAKVLSVRNPHAVFAIAPRGVGAEVVRATTSSGTSAANARSLLHYTSRILVVGDSLGIDLGWGFEPGVDARWNLSVVDDAVGSTGLVRSDFYDWPAHLRQDLAVVHPDVVVTMFGTNDDQAIVTAKGTDEPGTAAWDRVYAARIRQVATLVHRAGAALVWVGLPRMGPQTVLSQPFVAQVVTLDRTVVGRLHRATFVDTWPLFTTPDGAYTPYVELAPHVWVLGHAEDGTHLTPAGAEVIDATALGCLVHLLTRR